MPYNFDTQQQNFENERASITDFGFWVTGIKLRATRVVSSRACPDLVQTTASYQPFHTEPATGTQRAVFHVTVYMTCGMRPDR